VLERGLDLRRALHSPSHSLQQEVAAVVAGTWQVSLEVFRSCFNGF
jgi:hypothetical protein